MRAMATSADTRRARIAELLAALKLDQGRLGEIRAAVLLGLSDESTPHPRKGLSEAGHPISLSATTAEIFAYAAGEIGLSGKIDRETRDYVFPQLHEVGLVDYSTILPAADARRRGEPIHRGAHLTPKSPNNAYVLTDDGQRLLVEVDDESWPSVRDEWLGDSQKRRERIMRSQASEKLAHPREMTKHAALIRACVDALQETVASDYELVFIDDADGERVDERWQRALDDLGLLPDLSSRWPDGILVDRSSSLVWFVDGVTSDGEIDETRAKDLRQWASEKGYGVGGITTAYESWSRAGARLAGEGDLAIGTTLWIAEDGGKLIQIDSLATPD